MRLTPPVFPHGKSSTKVCLFYKPKQKKKKKKSVKSQIVKHVKSVVLKTYFKCSLLRLIKAILPGILPKTSDELKGQADFSASFVHAPGI